LAAMAARIIETWCAATFIAVVLASPWCVTLLL